ncbi:HAMP domain-containing protein [candidate division KSB1 bacterium]|nr:HAMP domain-containing protein [candidate division KSB1 bacterium]
MKISIRNKFILIQLSLLIIVTAFASIISTYNLQRFYKSRVLDELTKHIHAVKYILSQTENNSVSDSLNYNFLKGYAQASDLRLTLIDSSGWVLFDSQVPRDSLRFLENHLYRPEIQAALDQELGADTRLSATVNMPLFYAAEKVKIDKIRFVRFAIPLVEIEKVLADVQWKIFAGGGIALLLIGLITYLAATRFTRPILRLSKSAESVKKGNLDAYFEKISHDEVGELADVLNEMLSKLRHDLIQMRKLEKMRSQFLGNTSHELRTPIFTVQGILETLQDNPNCDSKTFSSFISKAHSQTVRLNNLLRDLIDISRIESGEMKLNSYPFNMVKCLQAQIEELQSTAAQNDVTLLFEKNNQADSVIILGDQERLGQVIINLVENAIKYNNPGGRVTVGYHLYDESVEIYISDTGRGIAEEHIPRIFERFYRVDKERSRAVGGTGLGLAIVKHIVEAHGSRVYVRSKVGEGSTFSFSLKRKL